MPDQQHKTSVSGRIARHDEEPFWGRITISDIGLIVKVEKGGGLPADHVFGPDCLIFPGFGDIHIHAREDATGKQCYKETYESAADAALHGGVVHISAMPNTPEPVVGKEHLAWHRHRIAEIKHPVIVLNYLGVDKGTSPIGLPGEYPYKVFFGKSVGDLTVMYASDLDRILSRYWGECVSFHIEYEPIVLNSTGGLTHSDRRPAMCVLEGLRLALALIEKHGILAKLCHWSLGEESFDLIREYRDRGCDIILEVSPLHLLFDTSMTAKDPSLWMKVQMNPAIQDRGHRLQLIEGLRSGFIQFLATDHAPHTEEEKYLAFAKFRGWYVGKSNKEMAALLSTENPDLYKKTCVENNTSGAPWLDTYALVCTWLMREHGFTPQDIARVAAYNPGCFVNQFLHVQYPGRNFGKGFGTIDVGYMGSLTVLNTEKPTIVRREDLRTKVGWSPLEGETLPGSIEAVFIAGQKF